MTKRLDEESKRRVAMISREEIEQPAGLGQRETITVIN
jgi:hypothetical protein